MAPQLTVASGALLLGGILIIGLPALAGAASSDAQPTAIKRVFVTSEKFQSNLGGLTGADAKCQALANAAHLHGIFKAWVSDYTASPSTRFTHSKGAYKLTNGTTIAKNWTDLTDGTIAAPIDVTELKFQIPPTITPAIATKLVWTGTDEHGLLLRIGEYPDADFTCSSWTSNSGDWPAATALYNSNLKPFAGFGCGPSARLFCFEQ